MNTSTKIITGVGIALSLVVLVVFIFVATSSSGTLGGAEEVKEIYSPNKSFTEYYQEYRKRKEAGENETALIIIFQDHISELVTLEVKEITEKHFNAVIQNNKEGYQKIKASDIENMLDHNDYPQSEKQLMSYYYTGHLISKCEKEDKINGCNDIYLKNLSELEKEKEALEF